MMIMPTCHHVMMLDGRGMRHSPPTMHTIAFQYFENPAIANTSIANSTASNPFPNNLQIDTRKHSSLQAS